MATATAAPPSPRPSGCGERREQLADAFSSAAMGADTTFAIIDTITTEAIRDRFTDYAGSVQAVMATDTLLSALVSRERRLGGGGERDPGRHQRRLSRGPRSQCL